jgi:hypothetical protein
MKMSNEVAGIKVGDVCVAITLVGEIAGRLKEVKDGSVVFADARLFIPSANDQSGGFSSGVSMTGKVNLDLMEINLSSVVAVIPAHPDIEKGWMEMTSGIIV